MRHALALGLCLLWTGAALAGGAVDDDCASAKQTDSWCDAHQVGYVASVLIPSKRLWETLDAHGHELELDSFTCSSCREAIESDGFCEEDRIGFVGGLAYFSRLTYELARGEIRDPASIPCSVCRVNAETHGWCDEHGVGMVGNVAIQDREGYEQIERALRILRAAIEVAGRCEHCAVAMVTDTECPRCRISYRDGVAVPEHAHPEPEED